MLVAILGPLTLGTLFQRQSQRLSALAEQGQDTQGVVVGRSRDGGTTTYGYEVEGHRFTWSVRADQAPVAVGAALPVRYLREQPEFSRPTHDPAVIWAEVGRQRELAFGITGGVLLVLLALAALAHRDVRRAGAAPGPLDLRAYRRRLALTALILLVPIGGISAYHLRAAAEAGESPWAAGLAVLFPVLLLFGFLSWAGVVGPVAAPARAARWLRWAAPAALVLAILRWLGSIFSG